VNFLYFWEIFGKASKAAKNCNTSCPLLSSSKRKKGKDDEPLIISNEKDDYPFIDKKIQE